jgi:hypothetical protein
LLTFRIALLESVGKGFCSADEFEDFFLIHMIKALDNRMIIGRFLFFICGWLRRTSAKRCFRLFFAKEWIFLPD